MRIFYTVLFYLALPIILLRILWRGRQNPTYRERWYERLGFIPAQSTDSIWVHAVSVGESMAAIGLIEKLQQHYPNTPVLVSSTTPTGANIIKQRLNQKVQQVYMPYDLPSFVKRFITRAKPKLCVIMETELWPNVLHICQQQKVPLVLANARLSERSYRGYRRIRLLMQKMLQAFTLIIVQSKADAERFIKLGSDPKRLHIGGNIKFDVQAPIDITEKATALREQWGQKRPVFIAASTHEGEETLLINTYQLLQKQFDDLLMVLVPRHPERCEKVKILCESTGLTYQLRSLKQPIQNNTAILLGDTLGELMLLYAASDIAFVGGSLMPIGGHNLIEPALLKKPILTGPYLHNFSELTHLLKSVEACKIINNPKELADQVTQLLRQPNLSKTMSESAYHIIMQNGGALQKHFNWVTPILDHL